MSTQKYGKIYCVEFADKTYYLGDEIYGTKHIIKSIEVIGDEVWIGDEKDDGLIVVHGKPYTLHLYQKKRTDPPFEEF